MTKWDCTSCSELTVFRTTVLAREHLKANPSHRIEMYGEVTMTPKILTPTGTKRGQLR